MPMEECKLLDVELLTLIKNFKNTIALNNIMIKDKIIRKLDMISMMRFYGFPLMNFPIATGNKIIDELRRIDRLGDIIKYTIATNNTNKLLGNILHNSYQASGYNLILSNIPITGVTALGNTILIDSEAIYDTLSQYVAKKSILSICQISGDTYLVKIDTDDNAREICELLNGKILEGNVIKVEFIDSFAHVNNNVIEEFENSNLNLNLTVDQIEQINQLNSKCINMESRTHVNKGFTGVTNASGFSSYIDWIKNILVKVIRKFQFWK